MIDVLVMLSSLAVCGASSGSQQMQLNRQLPKQIVPVTLCHLKPLHHPMRCRHPALRQVQRTAPQTRRSLHHQVLPPVKNRVEPFSDFQFFEVQVLFHSISKKLNVTWMGDLRKIWEVCFWVWSKYSYLFAPNQIFVLKLFILLLKLFISAARYYHM